MPKNHKKMEMIKMYHNRQSIRLQNYDYAQNGRYYITICTKNRENILSEIKLNNNCCREYIYYH